MKKRVLNVFKRAGKAYFKGIYELYGPALSHGVNPWF